jgi:hypothetical protein
VGGREGGRKEGREGERERERPVSIDASKRCWRDEGAASRTPSHGTVSPWRRHTTSPTCSTAAST